MMLRFRLTYTALPEAGHEVRLRIHTHVREDALALYGFLTADEKMMFERLISVSGIGPKLAITVLSGVAAAELIAAIRGGETARLVRIPGIGKKTAERMVLELREKLPPVDGAAASTPAGAPAMSVLDQDVISALPISAARLLRLKRRCVRRNPTAARAVSRHYSGGRSNWCGRQYKEEHARSRNCFGFGSGRRTAVRS